MALALAGCGADVRHQYPEKAARNRYEIGGPAETIFSETDDGRPNLLSFASGGGSAGGANRILWQAALDSVAFMPLASADRLGGVIVTDWYGAEKNPNERFKLTVRIVGSEMRADAVKVTVFKEIRKSGDWRTADVPSDMAAGIRDAVIASAKEIKAEKGGKK